jgi:SH3/ankyrin repeat-containing protein
MIMTLVNGGAHLDFRTRNGGLTPLHKSAIHSQKESIIVGYKFSNFRKFFFRKNQVLLELGASPNVYDEKGLTPLYHTLLNKQIESINNSSYCCQLLLQDHSIVNCRDDYLSTELHQACRLGLVQHVEHLLFYRADINAINLAGNTPLHICAATNQVIIN